MPTALDTTIRDLLRRTRWASFVGEWSAHLLGAAFLVGTVVLLGRIGLRWEFAQARWALLALLASPLTAAWRARSRRVSAETAAGWIDIRSGATGLVLTDAELHDERWADKARSLTDESRFRLPRWNTRPMLVRAGTALAFVVLALWVPIPEPTTGPTPKLFDRSLDALSSKLETLEEQVELDDETAEELHARLDRLAGEAHDGRNPEATFEAIDQLAQRLEEEARDASEAAVDATESLATSAEFAQANPESAQESLEAALAELEASGLAPKLPSELNAALAESAGMLPEGLKLDPAALSELSSSLRQALSEKLSKLGEAGLLKAGEKLAEFEQLGSLAGFEYSQEPCDGNCKPGPGGTCLRHGRTAGAGDQPGRGGVGRGRADAALTWGNETAGQTDQFAAKVLPAAVYQDLDNSVLFGVGAAQPQVEPSAEGAGSVTTQASTGSTTWRRRLSPKHRRAVGRFFSSDTKSE